MNWNYTFSRREKTLMVILAAILLIALWYNVVYVPFNNRYDAAVAGKADLESSIDESQAMLIKMQQMQDEIDAAKASGKVTSLPTYDNLTNVTAELNTILASASSYSLSFGDITFGDDGTVRRPVTISFYAASYESAKQIVTSIDNSKFRCQMDSCNIIDSTTGNISAGKGTAPVSVVLTITYFEAS